MRKLGLLAPLALLLVGCGGSDNSIDIVPGSGATLYLVRDGNSLLTTRANTPGTVRSRMDITGLQGGERIVGLDVRPANGQLYALTTGGRLYQVSPSTGAATQVGTAVAPFTIGTGVGFDFNPTVDRIRVVLADGTNFRMNPDTGAVVDTDPNTPDVQLDANINPATEQVSAVAYTNSFAGATSTTLFGLSSTGNQLVRIGGENGTPSPNGGAVTVVGNLGVPLTGPRNGFDISTGGTAYAVFQSGSATRVYTLNLATGAATPVGTLPGEDGPITAFTIVQ
jgi:hypothetical protein